MTATEQSILDFESSVVTSVLTNFWCIYVEDREVPCVGLISERSMFCCKTCRLALLKTCLETTEKLMERKFPRMRLRSIHNFFVT